MEGMQFIDINSREFKNTMLAIVREAMKLEKINSGSNVVPEYVGPSEAAKALRVKEGTLHRYTSLGMPYITGKPNRYNLKDIVEWAKENL